MISMAHAAAASALGHPVVAVASRTPERATSVASRLGATAVGYDDLPGSADTVVVCTPPQRHHDDVLRLLGTGCAVVVEKPLCRTLDEADALVAAAAKYDQRLLYAENLAYAPAVQRMLSLVERVGTITHVEIRMLQGLPGWGDFTSDEWGGGALFDLGIHGVALALMISNVAGLGRPSAVRAALRGGEGHGSDEHAEVTFVHGDAALIHLVSSWQGGDAGVWDVQVAGTEGVVRLELQPTVSLEWNGTPVALPATTTGTLPVVEQLGYVGQLRAFIDDLAASRLPMMSAAFGREALDATMAAYAAAGREEEVALPYAGRRDLTPLETWRHGISRGTA
jgi:predicted dehydrogenase